MTRRLVIRPQAEADITEAALWFQKQAPGLEEACLLEWRKLIDYIHFDHLLKLSIKNKHSIEIIVPICVFTACFKLKMQN